MILDILVAAGVWVGLTAICLAVVGANSRWEREEEDYDTELDMFLFLEAVNKNKPAPGEVKKCPCPLCGGTVLISCSKENGHVSAQCDICGMRVQE